MNYLIKKQAIEFNYSTGIKEIGEPTAFMERCTEVETKDKMIFLMTDSKLLSFARSEDNTISKKVKDNSHGTKYMLIERDSQIDDDYQITSSERVVVELYTFDSLYCSK